MKRCLNSACNAENQDATKFCVKCGQKFVETPVAAVTVEVNNKNEQTTQLAPIKEQVIVEQETPQSNPTNKLPETKVSKKSIKTIVAALVTIVVLAVSIILIKQSEDGTRILADLQEAAENNDVDKFYKQLTIEADIHVDETSYKIFLQQYGLINLYSEIEEAITSLYDSKDESIVVGKDDMLMFYVNNVEKGFEIVPISTVVELYSEGPDYTVTFNEQTFDITADEPVIIGNFLVGEYEYKINVDLYNIEVTQKKVLTVPNTFVHTSEVALNLYEVEVHSVYPSATLFINGNSIDIEIGDYVTIALPEGSSYELTANLKQNDQEFISETIEVTEEDSITFTFAEHDDELGAALDEETAINFIEGFRKQFELSLNTIDFSLISNYFSEGTQQYKDYEQFILDHLNIGSYRYEFEENLYGSFELIEGNKGVLTSFEVFQYDSSEDGSYLYERQKEYTIIYNPTKQNFEIENISIVTTDKTKY